MSDEATRRWLREEVLPRLQRAGIRLVEAPTDEQLGWTVSYLQHMRRDHWGWLSKWIMGACGFVHCGNASILLGPGGQYGAHECFKRGGHDGPCGLGTLPAGWSRKPA